jgi:hypothetical protein
LKLLKVAQQSISRLLPVEDRECFAAAKLAIDYALEWRPLKVRGILLCESHKHTPEEAVLHGPQMRQELLPQYHGPRGLLFHVSNFFYGLNECGTSHLPNNLGSPQFWKLLGTAAYGYEKFIESGNYKKLLKTGNNSWQSILTERYTLLLRLKERGIWLVDTSIYGWYMTQETKFKQSSVSLEVVKTTKERPPKDLKQITLVFSWELYVKHMVRQSALEGQLRFIMPIGKSVGAALSQKRLDDVISVVGCNAVIEINPPAPNAMVKKGYNRYYHRISATINGHVDSL